MTARTSATEHAEQRPKEEMADGRDGRRGNLHPAGRHEKPCLSSVAMLVIAAPLLGLSLGALFAWASAEELARVGGSVPSRALAVAALFGAVVYAPACGYFEAFFPDWSYAYFLDSQRRPTALDLALVIADGISVPVGLALFAQSAASRHIGALARGVAGPSLAPRLLLFGILSRPRIFSTSSKVPR